MHIRMFLVDLIVVYGKECTSSRRPSRQMKVTIKSPALRRRIRRASERGHTIAAHVIAEMGEMDVVR